MIEEFCDWLSATPLSVAFQSANWFVPLVQTVHILCIAILLISIYLMGFRLLGLGRHSPSLAATMSHSAPWIWTALGVLLATGTLLTITEPARELLNWAFRAKMLMVLGLVIVLLLVQSRLRQDPDYWSLSPARKLAGRLVGLLVLVIGAGIIVAGRWIAYV